MYEMSGLFDNLGVSTQTLETIQPENYEIDREQISKLVVDSGESAEKDGVLLQAEMDQEEKSPEQRKRHRSLTTGHKLRILYELKHGRAAEDICRAHRISRTSLALIACDDNLQEVSNVNYIEKTKKIAAARFYQLADVCLSHIDPRKLERLDAYKLGMLAAIALDKARLIEGQPTENLSFRNLSMSIQGTLNDLQIRKSKVLDMLAVKTGREITSDGTTYTSAIELVKEEKANEYID